MCFQLVFSDSSLAVGGQKTWHFLQELDSFLSTIWAHIFRGRLYLNVSCICMGWRVLGYSYAGDNINIIRDPSQPRAFQWAPWERSTAVMNKCKALCVNACFKVQRSWAKLLISAYLGTLKAKPALWRMRQPTQRIRRLSETQRLQHDTAIQQHDWDYETVPRKRKITLVQSG